MTSSAETLRALIADGASGRTVPERLCDHCAEDRPIVHIAREVLAGTLRFQLGGRDHE